MPKVGNGSPPPPSSEAPGDRVMRDGTADAAPCRAVTHRIRLKLEEYARDGRVPARLPVMAVRAAGRRFLAVVVGAGAAAAPGGGVRVSAGRQVYRRATLLTAHAHEHSLRLLH